MNNRKGAKIPVPASLLKKNLLPSPKKHAAMSSYSHVTIQFTYFSIRPCTDLQMEHASTGTCPYTPCSIISSRKGLSSNVCMYMHNTATTLKRVQRGARACTQVKAGFNEANLVALKLTYTLYNALIKIHSGWITPPPCYTVWERQLFFTTTKYSNTQIFHINLLRERNRHSRKNQDNVKSKVCVCWQGEWYWTGAGCGQVARHLSRFPAPTVVARSLLCCCGPTFRCCSDLARHTKAGSAWKPIFTD